MQLKQLANLIKFTSLIVLFAITDNLIASEAPVKSAQKLQISAIPYELIAPVTDGKATVQNNELDLSAFKNTDMFNDVFSGNKKDNAPKLLFQPKGDFIFSAKISGKFNGKYDGGALVLYNDNTSWAKLLFELSHDGSLSVWTTITKGQTDDVNHRSYNEKSLYLKIVNANNVYLFYASANGKDWDMLRSFKMDKTDTIKLGFLAQSPEGNGFTAHFSDIKYTAKSFSDFWQGE